MLREIEEIDLLRLVEGDCSPNEAAALQAWIGAHPRRLQVLEEVRAVWRLTGPATRSWVVAEARLRLLPRRGRHAAQRPDRSSARGPVPPRPRHPTTNHSLLAPRSVTTQRVNVRGAGTPKHSAGPRVNLRLGAKEVTR